MQTAPDNPLIYNLLGQIYAKQGDNTQAEAAFHKAIKLDEHVLASYFNLAGLYAINKAYDQAIQQAEIIIKAHPRLVPPYMLLGVLYNMQGKHRKANEYFEKALELNPQFAPAANNLAWNYAEYGGNIDVALSWAQTAKAQLPDNPNIADTLGWIYYKKRAYGQAISLLRESAEKMASNPLVHYHLGMAYYKNGQTENAKEALHKAFQLKQDFLGAQEARQVLETLK